MNRLVLTILSLLLTLSAKPQTDLRKKIENYLYNQRAIDQLLRIPVHLQKFDINDTLRTVTVTADSHLGERVFTPKSTETIINDIRGLLPPNKQGYEISVITGGWDIHQLVPERFQQERVKGRNWGDISYDGRPWVSNASLPYEITNGLQNRHLSIWASHGYYYNQKDGRWEWQRPALFATREDLFTQTIVTPYLIPMLEKAGAIVFSPRERDWQDHEAVIDNDTRRAADGSRYVETNGLYAWQTTDSAGFAFHEGYYEDGENPFTSGTARQARTVSHTHDQSDIAYIPNIPMTGNYAVYVSYQTVKGSVDDAHYTVWHQGIGTEFRVNQQMGGSTWVYLGNFDFDEGSSANNCVVLSNKSSHEGIVTADGVRFGGGMGNISRNGMSSELPRFAEGARYFAQWSGMPYSVYSTKNGEDDYGDDINARSCMTNLLAGGSCYMPDTTGRGVPLELSLAIHSDAGFTRDGKTHTGTLSICTTYLNDSILNAGLTRLVSRDLADELLTSVPNDIQSLYGEWQRRELYDRNYSESRIPEVPSAILETMSHQNFADMRYGQDPNFRFDLARSIYKTLLRFICRMHGTSYTVTPLTPTQLNVTLTNKGEALLNWTPVEDPLESSAKPKGYIVYTAVGKGGFDNGYYVKGKYTSMTIPLKPGQLYSFRVTAVNDGGESFPSEVVSTYYIPDASKTVLVVNGFHRLSSPFVRDNEVEQGFDLEEDPGVSYGRTTGWTGYQTCFNKSAMGNESPSGLGYSDDRLAGRIIAGNDFNYIRTHASAIATAQCYNIVSCSNETLESGKIIPTKYDMIDLILGLERRDGHSLKPYQAMSPTLQHLLQQYTANGGSLLVSGSYVGTDMSMPTERRYIEDVLKCTYIGTNKDSLRRNTITGLGTTFDFYRELNEQHYAATHPDVLLPVAPAFTAMIYGDSQSACVAYNGHDYKAMTIGFPFECIQSEKKRELLMRGILKFLIN